MNARTYALAAALTLGGALGYALGRVWQLATEEGFRDGFTVAEAVQLAQSASRRASE